MDREVAAHYRYSSHVQRRWRAGRFEFRAAFLVFVERTYTDDGSDPKGESFNVCASHSNNLASNNRVRNVEPEWSQISGEQMSVSRPALLNRPDDGYLPGEQSPLSAL